MVGTLDERLRRHLGRTGDALEKQLGLATVRDLLTHYPRRYVERGELTPLSSLREGEHATVMARVAQVSNRRMRQRPGTILEIVVTDGTGSLTLTFFNSAWRQRDLRPERVGLFAGKVTSFRGKRQLTQPDYQLLDDVEDPEDVARFAAAILPVYPATSSLPTWQIAKAVATVLPLAEDVEEPLPPGLLVRHDLVDLGTALHDVHLPPSWPALRAARRRLRFDEAFALQVTLAQRRRAAAASPATPRAVRPDGLLAAFDAQLPFSLTAGQLDVGAQILADLAERHPMHRLLQGEVGAGKTVVALRAMLAVIDAGGQAALLAPTEVLAQQHARSIRALLGPLGAGGELGAADGATRLVLLTGSLGAQARRTALLAAASGDAGIVVGTHALLEERVQFADLGLVVVDEQHRFGVEQRDALRAKGTEPPHVLVMTATPIPRTVAMTVYGDLETSVLRELPAGRAPIATHVVAAANEQWMSRTWGRVRDEAAAGHRAYVVCPRIGDAGAEDQEPAPAEEAADSRGPAAAVLEVGPLLAEGELSSLRVGILHGRMPPEEKDRTMASFAAGRLDVLVATTVVEVGVDVAAATVMVILDADRYGVSQLHQLRGRVGRGGAPGWCLLVTDAADGTPAKDRLLAVAATADGFELARLDLEQRREGDVLGAVQSGRRSQLKLLRLLRDEDIIAVARDEAISLVDASPDLAEHPALASAVAAFLDEERADYLEKA